MATPPTEVLNIAPRDVPYYKDYVSDALLERLLKEAKKVVGVEDLLEVGSGGGLEKPEALKFLCELYSKLKDDLARVLNQRVADRIFIDQRVRACFELNRSLNVDFLDPEYETVIGQEDGKGRIVIGPKNDFYSKRGQGKPVAPIPDFLQGPHVTLFGPPDDPKLSINAMNSYHRKIKDEPAIVSKVLESCRFSPKWGADDEDSKTPLRHDLVGAGMNLTGCINGTLEVNDANKHYRLQKEKAALPIKRFPGLALPSVFLFYKENPLPLHLYDFALHFFEHWNNPKALCFYVPKLENEEEARYVRIMIETAEKMLQRIHPEYKIGTVRLFIVLENPRAIFRTNEIMDELYPYFAGASLGWHDYLASTARLFKEDSNYRIPVKADPDIVIKYIHASHHLLAEVVGTRGGIKIGGMYGVLPINADLMSESFQVTIKGFIKDVITQLKRDLSGFWVAHPDFVRIGMALVTAYKSKNKSDLEQLIMSLLDPKYHKEILNFVSGPDIAGLDPTHDLHQRSLIVADIKESNFIANNHPDEIRYNVFQSLQYLADWLSGNGCVALPAQIGGVAVRVMDDLATAERSRWEVWHEIQHNRFGLDEFLKIAHEEMHFIRKDLSNDVKIVQVKWGERTSKWYPVAFNLMIQLMTAEKPAEFASELLLPFTVDSIRHAPDPWAEAAKVDSKKYSFQPYVEAFNRYFSVCGSVRFASAMASRFVPDLARAENIIRSFTKHEIIEAAAFHGDIGESKKTLDEFAAQEQAAVTQEAEDIKYMIRRFGFDYKKKFGIKFLISAKDKSGEEILDAMKSRYRNSEEQELNNARDALWQISQKRMHQTSNLKTKIDELLVKYDIKSAQVSIIDNARAQDISFNTSDNTWFELASLSKSISSAYALEYFQTQKIPLDTTVNKLLSMTESKFRIQSPDNKDWADQVTLAHLLSHTALNMHYVNGIPANQPMPDVSEWINEGNKYQNEPVKVVEAPGTKFRYSGAGFLLLEHLLQAREKKPVQVLTKKFLEDLKIKNLGFEQQTLPNIEYATGYLDDNSPVAGTRKMFPAFAAGAMGTSRAMLEFLKHLAFAYNSVSGSGPISHKTAATMLDGTDKGSHEFMGAKIGAGVFVAEAGANRFAVHQGANDGFRALFLYGFSGPDKDKGFVILCNGDNKGVAFIAETAQHILKDLRVEGVDHTKFKTILSLEGLAQEEIVNRGYKDLLLSAFEPDLPEEIAAKGEVDPLTPFNLAVGASIQSVTDQRFARAENLLSPFLPVFDPELYGRQGKIMDSWESARHNQLTGDELVFEIKKTVPVHYVSVSTKYHFGNQAQSIMVEGKSSKDEAWRTLVPLTSLEGHALKRILSIDASTSIKFVRVTMFPDGGLTRLGLYGKDLPAHEAEKYFGSTNTLNEKFTDTISHSARPLTPKYRATPERIKKNYDRMSPSSALDLASAAFGAKVLQASNEHFGPAAQIISPFPPIHMFDGFESARSRNAGHSEHVTVELGRISKIGRIEVDFTFFKNNNPKEIIIEGLTSSDQWVMLVARNPVKKYAGNKVAFPIDQNSEFKRIKITVIPDGGINRIHVFTPHD